MTPVACCNGGHDVRCSYLLRLGRIHQFLVEFAAELSPQSVGRLRSSHFFVLQGRHSPDRLHWGTIIAVTYGRLGKGSADGIIFSADRFPLIASTIATVVMGSTPYSACTSPITTVFSSSQSPTTFCRG